jgi:hypothetical protein
MIKARLLTTLTALIALPMVAGAQATPVQAVPAPFIHHTFEADDSGWQAQGTSGKVSITHDAAHVKENKAALQFDYTIAKNELSLLMLPTPVGSLAKAKSIRFWVLSDHPSPLFVSLPEHEGGRYVALVAVPQFKWQQVELSPSDFVLSDDNNDPPDPNNHLDMDKVEGVAILDVGQMIAQADSPFAKLFDIKQGPHSLYVDDFSIGEQTLPNASSAVNHDVRLDTFIRPQVGWFGVGGYKFSINIGKPLEGRSLQLDYHQTPQQFSAFMRRIPRGQLAGTDKLTFSAAALHATKLLIQIENKDGLKYNTMVEVPGEKAAHDYSVNFSEFKPGDDSKDKNAPLDLTKIHQVLFIDVSGFVDSADTDNTLWINNLRASPK